MELQELINECLDYIEFNFKGEDLTISGKGKNVTLTFLDEEFSGDLETAYKKLFKFLEEDNYKRELENMQFRKGWDMAYGF